MYLHLHHARHAMGWILGIVAFSPFALIFVSPSPNFSLSDVTGRVTYSGRPLNQLTICLDSEGGVHSAFGSLGSDGSFRLLSMSEGCAGAAPGRYQAHLFGHSHSSPFPAKYREARTSGLEIEIPSDWSDIHIELR